MKYMFIYIKGPLSLESDFKISMKDLKFTKTLVQTFRRQHLQVLCRFSNLFIIMVIFGRLGVIPCIKLPQKIKFYTDPLRFS